MIETERISKQVIGQHQEQIDREEKMSKWLLEKGERAVELEVVIGAGGNQRDERQEFFFLL